MKLGGGGDTLVFERGEETGENGFADKRQRDAVIQGGHGRPLSRPFLPGRIHNFVHHRRAIFRLKGQNLGRDLDEIGIELALIPIGKNTAHLSRRYARHRAQQIIRFADKLHIAIFDAIVDHFYKMTGAICTHPITARCAIGHFGGDCLENIFDVRPCGR